VIGKERLMQHSALLMMGILSVFLSIALIPALQVRPVRKLAASKISAAIRRT